MTENRAVRRGPTQIFYSYSIIEMSMWLNEILDFESHAIVLLKIGTK